MHHQSLSFSVHLFGITGVYAVSIKQVNLYNMTVLICVKVQLEVMFYNRECSITQDKIGMFGETCGGSLG